jgi:hypothetical protein
MVRIITKLFPRHNKKRAVREDGTLFPQKASRYAPTAPPSADATPETTAVISIHQAAVAAVRDGTILRFGLRYRVPKRRWFLNE